MSRRLHRLLVPAVSVGLVLGAIPAFAAGGAVASPDHAVDSRLVSVSRVVERVEIGVLDGSEPSVVKRRVLRNMPVDTSRSFQAAIRSASIRSHSESCYYAKPSWRRYNGFGKLATKVWYYIEWCGREGRVTRVLTFFCGGAAAQGFGYDGCSIRRGASGHARVNVTGTWRFPFRFGVYTFITRTITVSARHYATGRYTGTWWMHQ